MGRPVIAQIEEVYYPILALVGIPANILTILILTREKCGLSRCITRYFMGMAAADLLNMTTGIFDAKKLMQNITDENLDISMNDVEKTFRSQALENLSQREDFRQRLGSK
ncbi:hypothetical protein scyTo_0002319 [Scyliorhinus torazame]|uniref:Uncharacterized protein n=1 Tax=Scyliorhinus torazame TaxID=75743 RepID=A0A401PIU3_SCYTO|nr:hypothetical protein [Scyliorhinus torazame]